MSEYTNLNDHDCKEVIHLMVKQAVSDYVHFFFPKNRKQRKALYTAEGFLFDDDYLVQWGDSELNLEDLLFLLAENNDPININLLREQIRRTAYEHNFEEKKIKKNAQLTLDFRGISKLGDNDEEEGE